MYLWASNCTAWQLHASGYYMIIETPLVGRKTSAFGISCVGSSFPYVGFVFLDFPKHSSDVTFKDGRDAFGELSHKLKVANSARGLSQTYQNLCPSNSHWL
jgi:hypothetical protein